MTSSDAFAIDALAGFLPLVARDRLAETLTPAEIDTLTHLAKTGTGANSLRALASDLAYLEAWARASTGDALVWPASETTVLRFIAHHLWDEAEREKNPEHGMPQQVAEALRADGRLKSAGPHAPATVRRRLALWCSLHRWRGLEGLFANASIRNALRLAIRAADRPRARKSPSAITRDVLDKLIATCGRGRAVDLRDRALLLLAFGSGGRRRSEIAKLKVDDLEEREPVVADPAAPDDEKLPVLAIRLRRTKTSSAEAGESVLIVGRPVDALRAWLASSKIEAGPVFRPIDKWGNIGSGPLDPQSVNALIKSRCAVAGLDPREFSAHGLRSGYLTEAARAGVSLPEAMQQSRHRSVQQAARYYNEGEIARGRAARLA
jgi:integrase